MYGYSESPWETCMARRKPGRGLVERKGEFHHPCHKIENPQHGSLKQIMQVSQFGMPCKVRKEFVLMELSKYSSLFWSPMLLLMTAMAMRETLMLGMIEAFTACCSEL
ncbi:uncharacterized protein A4U43_C07F23040 [Asparagus officinalis]|uniref:Uncharacterized protein n=1 Tax=Asparagus officinalis TaxID=4686 RepID=A0A5P1EJE4_ASPOF|nr:uncharacterized protein A4U43_C07F23040 [Asparagus officinalis]